MIRTAILVLCAVAPSLANDDTPDEKPALDSHQRMLATLQRMRDEARVSDPFFGTASLEEARRALAGSPLQADPKQRWMVLRVIGFHELRLGRTQEAIAAYDEARRIVESHSKLFAPAEAVDTAFELGLAWLREGENANCITECCSASCVFPIAGEGVHSKPRGSQMAVMLFDWVLKVKPDHAAARWLINIAAMTLGEHPAKVPENFRIDLTRFGDGSGFPRFENVSKSLGLDTPSLAGGIVADDFDGDGVIDLVNSSWGPHEQIRFWKGGADGKFTERTNASGMLGITGGLQLVHADYDNDGDLDLLVLRGAWMRSAGRWPNSLLQNNGKGVFFDVTYDVGLAEPMLPTQTAAWADYDNDGDLDLYVGNESSQEFAAPSQLFRNDKGKFVDVSDAAGVANGGFAKGVAWGDVDGDGFADLYVSNSGAENRLYRNRGDGTFEDIAKKAGVTLPLSSFSTWFFDYDNDGALDLFVASYMPVLDPYVAWASGVDARTEHQALYKGDGKGGFRNVTGEVGLERPNVTMGSNYGDLDNDGFDDIYLATGFPGYEALTPNVTFWNRRGVSFVDVTSASGMGHLQKGHGVAMFDFDGDGDLDVYEDLGGAFPGDGFGSALFRNPGSENGWLGVTLVGVRSNRCAIGAQIRVDVLERGATRSLHRRVTSGSSFGGNPLRQHFGLGRAEKIERIEVFWPASKTRQTFTDVAPNRVVRIREGADDLESGSSGSGG